VLFPAPSPETGVSVFWRVAFRKAVPVWQVAPAEREGALRNTRGRVCSPSNHGLAQGRRFWHGWRVKKIFLILPAGIPGSAIRYGAVAAQGRTGLNGNQPYPTPDTFIGPVGVEYPAPEVGLTIAAGQVRLGLAGLVVGREYRVMRSVDLVGWAEAARFTVTEDPWPASGRVDREWSEAAVLPGRRFYRIEWEEP
jgi:hypothetical protein